MSRRKDLKQALHISKPNYAEIIGRAIDRVSKVEKMEENTTDDPKKGHHVINKGVNDLYKDIFKFFFYEYGDKEKYLTKGINYNALRNSKKVDEHCIPTGDLGLFDIPSRIKEKIDWMTVKKPNNIEEYNNSNAKEFSCAKIVLLACVHCVMLDVHIALTKRKKMPARFDEKLTFMRNITIAYLIKENGDGVYVDNTAKEWWISENPREVEVFKMCKESVERFLENIAVNFDLVIRWGLWVYQMGKKLRFRQEPNLFTSLIQ